MLVGKSTKVEVDNMCLSGRVGECLKTKGECGTEVEEKVLTSAGRSWVWLLAKRRATWAPETSDPPGLRLDNHGNHVRFLEQKKKTLDMIEIALMAVSFCFQFPSTSINTHFLSWCRLPTARLEDSNPYPSGFSTSFTRSISSISSVAGTFWRIFQAINKLLESSGDPCGGILRKESRWEEKCSHMGGANLRQEEEEENRLEGRPSGAVAHTRSICAHLPPVSHTLVPHCSGGGDPLRSCWVPFLLYFSDQVVTPSLLLFWLHSQLIGVTGEDVLPEPKPSDALDLALLQLCLPTKPSLKAAGLGQPLWWVFKSFHGVHNPCISGEQALWNKVSAEILQSIPSRTSASAAQRKYKMIWEGEPHHNLQGIEETRPGQTSGGMRTMEHRIVSFHYSNGRKQRSRWKKPKLTRNFLARSESLELSKFITFQLQRGCLLWQLNVISTKWLSTLLLEECGIRKKPSRGQFLGQYYICSGCPPPHSL